MLSSTTFMVPSLIFKFVSHFEFIFVYGIRECSNFIDLYAAVQLSQHHLLKRLSFLHCIFLLPLLRLIDHMHVGLFLGSLCCSIGLCICFYANTILSYCSSIYSLKSGSMMTPVLFFFLKVALVIQVFNVSIEILGLFILFLWEKMPLEFC